MHIGVVAHDSRKALSQRMIEAVQADVVEYDSGTPSVNACADNHIRVLTALNDVANGDWVVVLEDDALPVPDFRHHVELALAKTGGEIVGLYLGTGNPNGVVQEAVMPAVREAAATQNAWIVADWFLATVGYAVRPERLPGLIASLSSGTGPVDNRINSWTHQVGLETWYTQPSLVDHEDGSSVLSAWTPYPRHAHNVGFRKVWNQRAVRMAQVEGWSPAHA